MTELSPTARPDRMAIMPCPTSAQPGGKCIVAVTTLHPLHGELRTTAARVLLCARCAVIISLSSSFWMDVLSTPIGRGYCPGNQTGIRWIDFGEPPLSSLLSLPSSISALSALCPLPSARRALAHLFCSHLCFTSLCLESTLRYLS